MRILAVWPPSVPTYFNAGHHLALWETAAYLRRLPEVAQVDVLDGGALNVTWERVARELIKGWDLIAVQNEFDTVPALRMLVSYSRELSPNARVLTFGRASCLLPGFFQRYDLDAIVASGDFEPGIAGYVKRLAGKCNLDGLQGLIVRTGKGFEQTGIGAFLPPEQWAFPPVQEVPWDCYNAMYADDAMKFSGLPRKRELPVPISRGCPLGCGFCLVSRCQGRRERRRSVESVMEYIDRARADYEFDYVATYSPTFTLQRDWVMEFCRALARRMEVSAWKTCTTLHHLDEELVESMAASRCIRISVGLESLDVNTHKFLPKAKRATEEQLRQVAQWCNARGVELNCLIMLGMPGQTPGGLEHTFKVAQEVGAKIRPMIYTDYSGLHEGMDEYELTRNCRQLAVGEIFESADRSHLYRLRFGNS